MAFRQFFQVLDQTLTCKGGFLNNALIIWTEPEDGLGSFAGEREVIKSHSLFNRTESQHAARKRNRYGGSGAMRGEEERNGYSTR